MFDEIDHGLLMKAVRAHIKDDWIVLYIERWLTAPFETADGMRQPRERGTPQGGVVSPILMNLFMHYAFDGWMQRTYSQCPFARYADDAVVHCRSRKQAEDVMQAIAERLAACGLKMHPEKSKVVYCKGSKRRGRHTDVSFTFLGFTFRPRAARGKGTRVFTGFLPGASKDALKRMRQTVRGWHLTRQTPATLADLARQCNSVLRGWWNYHGAFYRTAMLDIARHIDRALERWARQKYKRLRGRKRRSQAWLGQMKERYPWPFFHWQVTGHEVG